MISSKDRPEPIRDALAKVAAYTAVLVAAVAWLGTKGILSTAQADLVGQYAAILDGWTTDLGAITAAVLAGGGVYGAIRLAARHAAGWSTPSSDPRDTDMTPLMRVDGKLLGGYEPPPFNVGDAPYSDPDMPPTSRERWDGNDLI